METNETLRRFMESLSEITVPLKKCMEEVRGLREKIKGIDYKDTSSLYEYSGRLAALEPRVLVHSQTAVPYLENARQALTTLAYTKERVLKDPRIAWMKLFDAFGVFNYSGTMFDSLFRAYIGNLLNSAIRELEATHKGK